MSSSEYEATGTLIFNTGSSDEHLTPIIKGLFGPFNVTTLDDKNNKGKAYIARADGKTSTKWSDIALSLDKVAETFGLSPLIERGMQEWISILSKNFNVDASSLVTEATIIEDHDADLCDLFKLAKIFNDGHGLTAISTQGAWHCDKLRLDEFGGDGIFISDEITYSVNSGEAGSLGASAKKYIDANDIQKLSALFNRQVRSLLTSITNPEIKEEIAFYVAAALKEDFKINPAMAPKRNKP